jgi:CheY-like chemotaxis protein
MERLARAMETRGFAVAIAESVAEGKARAKEAPPAYAVVDLKLDDGNGLDVVETLHTTRPDSRVVVLTISSEIIWFELLDERIILFLDRILRVEFNIFCTTGVSRSSQIMDESRMWTTLFCKIYALSSRQTTAYANCTTLLEGLPRISLKVLAQTIRWIFHTRSSQC